MRNNIKKAQNNVGGDYQAPKTQKNGYVWELLLKGDPKAITLISLIITIIILIILAGIAISLTIRRKWNS